MIIKNFNIIMISLTAFLLVAYFGLVINLVSSVVAHKQAVDKLATVSPAVTSLESQYVALSGQVTLDLAYHLGFQDAPESTYALLTKPSVY